MTNKQRRMVKSRYGITVPTNIPVRLLEFEDESSIILHVFPVAGQKPWVPFGAVKTEPGELDNHGRPTVMYHFHRLKSRKEKKNEKHS